MASQTSSGFMVYIHQCEIVEIRKQFEQRRKKESDGDLFGLWTNSGHAVVHLVSGMTKTSSINSSAVSSRERVNDLKILLEEKYMLCHIGKWRFNPSVTSSEPSASDKAAVERFYSRGDGQKACILLKFSEGKADIQAYLFVGRDHQVAANLSILSGSQSSNRDTENPLRNVPAIREKLRSALLQGIHTDLSTQSPSSSTTPNPAPKLNDAGEKILKQVQEKITSMVKDLKTVVLNRELKLEVNQIKCTVHFPETFPETPAKVVYRLPEQTYIFEVKDPNEKFDSVGSILSAVKCCFDCHIGLSSLSSANAVTTTARQVNDPLRSEALADNFDDTKDEVQKFAKEVQDKIKKTFEITGDVELDTKTEKCELSFEHPSRNSKKWIIVLPGKFREQPTQIYYVGDKSKRYHVGREVCGVSDQIVTVIKKNCACAQCLRSR